MNNYTYTIILSIYCNNVIVFLSLQQLKTKRKTCTNPSKIHVVVFPFIIYMTTTLIVIGSSVFRGWTWSDVHPLPGGQ